MPEFEKVKDSGEHQEFDTGSKRDTREGKGRYDLITPLGLKRLALHYENGAKKYGDRNWEKGQPICRYLDSAIRHAYNYLCGMRDEDHIAAIAWNALAVAHTEECIERGILPPELDDTVSFESAQELKQVVEKLSKVLAKDDEEKGN